MQHFSHSPIVINQLTISFGQKECIRQPFTNTIYSGQRVGIIGRNGSGKSSLIKALAGLSSTYEGELNIPNDVSLGYIPQLIVEENVQLSGGQRFNQQLTKTLVNSPNLLLLDEPTNHLDVHNKRSLFGLLKRYSGTLIAITHDIELLNFVDTIWHVLNGEIIVFNGSYAQYKLKQQQEWERLNNAVKQFDLEKKQAQQDLEKEQQRAKNSRLRGEKYIKERKWPTVTSATKMSRGVTTAGKNNKRIAQNKQAAVDKLKDIYVPEVIIPKFNLDAGQININKAILKIENGEVYYLTNTKPTLINITLQINATEKVVLHGNNGVGKSTLTKAILQNREINTSGTWEMPTIDEIGYVDQHYSNLDQNKTAVELLQELMPKWLYGEIRDHLNTFLLRKNEEVNLAFKYLSGGEKARLSLALIAVKPPKLLILDEITNNIDLETKEHLTQILSAYPGSIILICHDQNFIDNLNIDTNYLIKDRQIIGNINNILKI